MVVAYLFGKASASLVKITSYQACYFSAPPFAFRLLEEESEDQITTITDQMTAC